MHNEGISVSAGGGPFSTPIRCPMSGLGKAEMEEINLVLCPKSSSVQDDRLLSGYGYAH